RARLEQTPPDCGANGRIAVGPGPSSRSSRNVVLLEEVARTCAPTVSTSLGSTARPAFDEAGSPPQSTRSPAVGSKDPPGSWARRTSISTDGHLHAPYAARGTTLGPHPRSPYRCARGPDG